MNFMVLGLLLATFASRLELTVPFIMKSAALIGHAPRNLRWSADGKYVRFNWAKADGSQDPQYKDYTVSADGTGLRQGVPDDFLSPKIEPNFKPAAGLEAVIEDKDLVLRDSATGKTKKLTNTHDAGENPALTAAGDYAIYSKGGNLYRVRVADGATDRLTDIKVDDYPSQGKTAPELLREEEAALFKDFPPSEGSDPAPTRRPGSSTRVFSLSPDGIHASAQVFQAAPSSPTAMVPNYVTRSGYSEMIPTYPKVGVARSRSSVIIVDIPKRLSIEIKSPKIGRVNGANWAPDGKHAVLVATSEDRKDSWIFGFDGLTDKVTELWHEHDDAWLGGPGRFTLGWLPDSSHFYFESENSGYSHLMVSTPNGIVTPLTQGKFEVSDVRLDTPRKRLLFVSSEGSPFKRHIDAVSWDGGPSTKLADFSADEDATFALSPDGSQVAVVRSSPNRPAELFVNGKQVTTTPTDEWLKGPWIVPPVVMVPARDGIQVPARLYRPERWRRGGPAVIFIHGAGYLQNVYDGWSHYFREYMFHHLLAQHGYAVLDIDYRGSAGYGKAWRTAIYRHMGGKDLDDAVDGAAYLVKELGVNPKRIGIYGGSYGGFITLMAMFTSPDTFAAGAALRPVSDWANYNDGYTSNILNLPQDDPEAYKKSSPIYFAEGLKGSLLICHGVVDTNVHFQDTVRLVERLIELGKNHWSVAMYPVEDHAFRKPESWIDEYSRIFDLFNQTIGRP